MINYLKNLFKKQETTPVEQPITHKYVYRREISLIVTYNQPDGEGYQYKEYENIETNDIKLYNERKEKVVKEYEQIIRNIHTQLDDKSSDYIAFDSFLLKKSDFVNVKILIKDI